MATQLAKEEHLGEEFLPGLGGDCFLGSNQCRAARAVSEKNWLD